LHAVLLDIGTIHRATVAAYPLEQAATAYELLAGIRSLGKITLRP
jgi:hypothetical protein